MKNQMYFCILLVDKSEFMENLKYLMYLVYLQGSCSILEKHLT